MSCEVLLAFEGVKRGKGVGRWLEGEVWCHKLFSGNSADNFC